MTTYLALEPIFYRKTLHKPGSLIELDGKTASELHALGAITSVTNVGGPLGLILSRSGLEITPNSLPNSAPEQPPATPLPEDFPARDLLVAAELDTLEAVAGASETRLLATKGVSPMVAAKIRAALNPAPPETKA